VCCTIFFSFVEICLGCHLVFKSVRTADGVLACRTRYSSTKDIHDQPLFSLSCEGSIIYQKLCVGRIGVHFITRHCCETPLLHAHWHL
jgi:hypothetical protein